MPKALITDMGGVLIISDNYFEREKWAGRLGLNRHDLERYIFRSESARAAVLGHKTCEEHWQWVADHFSLDELDLNSLREDFFSGERLNEPLFDYYKRLKEAGYRLGLLTNAAGNTRHVLTETYPVLPHFDGIIISAEVGLVKPNRKIYRLAAESIRTRIEEVIFVDDLEENVEAARKVGMHALHFTDTPTTIARLQELTGID